MKIGLLGTGFGVAHASIYHRHPAVDEVIVFGRAPAKLAKIGAEFGFATTTELDAIYDDPSIDLVDVCSVGIEKESGGSASEVLLEYPGAIVRCSASALMPKPYGLRGGSRAAFSGAVLESSWTAGYDGRPSTMLTEYTAQDQRTIELPDSDPYTAVIEHVIACIQGRAASRLSPASVLDALRVTLDVHHALNTRD